MSPIPLDRSDEADLLVAAAQGRAEAVAWLLDEVAPTVYGFLWARVGGNQAVAEDLLQDTLVQAMTSADGFRGDAAVSTWMCGIARHLVARHWESERRADLARSRLRDVSSREPEPDTEQLVLDRDEVAAALGRLPTGHRQVLVLKYLDGLPVEDIAQEVGRSKVQVQSLLQRARDGLRRELSP